jgi:hypothetical protein
MILPFLLRLLPDVVLERLTAFNHREVKKSRKINKRMNKKESKRTLVEVLR